MGGNLTDRGINSGSTIERVRGVRGRTRNYTAIWRGRGRRKTEQLGGITESEAQVKNRRSVLGRELKSTESRKLQHKITHPEGVWHERTLVPAGIGDHPSGGGNGWDKEKRRVTARPRGSDVLGPITYELDLSAR